MEALPARGSRWGQRDLLLRALFGEERTMTGVDMEAIFEGDPSELRFSHSSSRKSDITGPAPAPA
jgi:hypothetical protein